MIAGRFAFLARGCRLLFDCKLAFLLTTDGLALRAAASIREEPGAGRCAAARQDPRRGGWVTGRPTAMCGDPAQRSGKTEYEG